MCLGGSAFGVGLDGHPLANAFPSMDGLRTSISSSPAGAQGIRFLPSHLVVLCLDSVSDVGLEYGIDHWQLTRALSWPQQVAYMFWEPCSSLQSEKHPCILSSK
jgi:hypothetical protein